MENQNSTLFRNISTARIRGMKKEIRDLGCKWEIRSAAGELWITHIKTGWRGYIRLSTGYPRYCESAEEAWHDAVNLARQMDSDWYSCD